MDDQTLTPDLTEAVFADPVTYLAGLGIDAVVVSTSTLAAAA
jgi:hypothetical protein